MKTISTKYSLGAAAAASAGLASVFTFAGCTSTEPGTRSASGTPSSAAGAPSAAASQHMDHSSHNGHEDHGTAAGQAMNHTMGTTGQEALQKLAGKDFDIAFLSQMIAHHEAAVVMAEQALKTAKSTRTRQDAQQVITAQAAEIKQMTDWLKQWYDTAPSKEQQALVNADMQSMMAMPVTSDDMFYEMMIPHHQGAIDMSELALNKAGRPEVKKLAGQIIRDQKSEIAAYQAILKNSHQ